jgi:hypothetical protein
VLVEKFEEIHGIQCRCAWQRIIRQVGIENFEIEQIPVTPKASAVKKLSLFNGQLSYVIDGGASRNLLL